MMRHGIPKKPNIVFISFMEIIYRVKIMMTRFIIIVVNAAVMIILLLKF